MQDVIGIDGIFLDSFQFYFILWGKLRADIVKNIYNDMQDVPK